MTSLRIINISQSLEASPPTPACFPDREAWASYLLMAQQNTKRGGPFKAGVYRAEFNFCEDCTLAHATAMSRADRCNPSRFRSIPIKKERASECVL